MRAMRVFAVPDIELNKTVPKLHTGRAHTKTINGITVSVINDISFWEAINPIQSLEFASVIIPIKTTMPKLSRQIRLIRGSTSSCLLAPIVLLTTMYLR